MDLSIDDSWTIVSVGGQQMLGKMVDHQEDREGVSLCPAYHLFMSMQPMAGGSVGLSYSCFPLYLTSDPGATLHISDPQSVLFFSSISVADKHKFAALVRAAENVRRRANAGEAGLVLPNGG